MTDYFKKVFGFDESDFANYIRNRDKSKDINPMSFATAGLQAPNPQSSIGYLQSLFQQQPQQQPQQQMGMLPYHPYLSGLMK